MELVEEEQANRQKAVNQAVANLQTRGITPHLAVVALHERYVRGELSLAQVGELMQQRATAILAAATPALPG
ncbi:antitoxin VbhA family protein [Hymenobacter coccineus]|uniref:Antitoxin VbhA domain-containing protein n=1 Tax=Hymenobacter coccineus TaxID=1908235 RepID=A0A1G1TMH5_9BACT|nr:antitoxin VbhA family protein [Hymenobacter coccineus]OGX92080.1 hypothetical protein BEN49_17190 [Hymenobacter coccineus]